MSSQGEASAARARVLHVSFFYDPQLNNIAYRLLEALDPAAYETLPLYLFAPRGDGPAAPPGGHCLGASPRDLRGLGRGGLARSIRSAGGTIEVAVAHRMRTALLLDTAYGDALPAGLVVVHGRGTLRRASRRRRVLRRLVPRWRFVAISQAVRADLEGAGVPAERILDLPNALDLDGARAKLLSPAAAREHLGVQGAGFLFGAITRLEEKKGVHTVLESLALLPEHVRLVILGDGPQRALLAAAVAASGLDARVHLAGHVPDAFRLVRAFDALVHPSHEEGFGMVLLEAMAGEIPIVATTAGGIPEVVGEEATLVPSGDPAALAEAMAALAGASAEARAAQGTALLTRARERFDLPRAHAAFRAMVAVLC